MRHTTLFQPELPLHINNSHSMRWFERRNLFRRNGELFDPSRHSVDSIAQPIAKAFVERHHYSRSFPYAVLSYGLFERTALVGVAVFSTPSNPRTFPSYCAVPTNAGLELGRFVLLDHVASNAETWFLARSFRALRNDRPNTQAILAYSDPVPRIALDGSVAHAGHTGLIYTAASATYLGRGRPKRLLLCNDGRALANRILHKIRSGSRGCRYAEALLRDATQLDREDEESPTEYVTRALHELRQIHHPGNHVYLWPLLDGRRRRALLESPAVQSRLTRAGQRPSAVDRSALGTCLRGTQTVP